MARGTKRDSYKIPPIEITRDQHQFLRVSAILKDQSMNEWVIDKLFSAMPGDWKGAMAAAMNAAPERPREADTEAEIDDSGDAPTIEDEAAQVVDPPKKRGRPKGVKNGEGKRSGKRTKQERRGADRSATYRMPGDGGWTDESEDDDADTETPVTDSLSNEERERLIDALKPPTADAFDDDDDGYEDDESEYEDEHGVDEVDLND